MLAALWLLLAAAVVFSGLMGWTMQAIGLGLVLALASGIIAGAVDVHVIEEEAEGHEHE